MRPRTYSYPEPPDADGNVAEPPSSEQIEALALEHQYPVEIDLVKPIQDAWYWWRTHTQTEPMPPMADHRRFLKEMARRAAALEESLIKAGTVERSAILDAVGSQNMDFEGLRRSVQWLRRGAGTGATGLKKSRAGPRGDDETLRLVCKLFELNVKAWGQDAPRITNAGKYSGRFFDFAADVLQIFGITKSNDALGKVIEKAIKIVDRKQIRQSP
jgi:hypothetical protein